MNPDQQARQLRDTLALRHLCDLDLLVFFARHPRTLLASEQLAAFMGYTLPQIAESLEGLLRVGLLTRTANSHHAMYVFALGGPHDGSFSSLVEFVSTRDGRLAMRRALTRHSAEGASSAASREESGRKSGGRLGPVVLPPKLERISEPQARQRGGR